MVVATQRFGDGNSCLKIVPDLMRSAMPFRSKLSSSGCLAAAYSLQCMNAGLEAGHNLLLTQQAYIKYRSISSHCQTNLMELG